MVPSYPAGLPIAMAVAMRIGGASAAYLVVPMFAALAVWVTYLIGAQIADRRAGMLAAILLAASPIFIFQSLEPMNDVPVTAWWLLAWLLALSPRGAFASGLCVSAAVLTRPNLVPLALVLAAVNAATAPRLRRAMRFAAGTIPGCLAVAALNIHWYGGALTSGYGTIGNLYRGAAPCRTCARYLGVDDRAAIGVRAARRGRAARRSREACGVLDARILRGAPRVLPALHRLRHLAVPPLPAPRHPAAADPRGHGCRPG